MNTSRLGSTLLALAATTASVLALSAPADAAVRTVPDPRGDAKAAIDVIHVTYTNEKNIAKATLKVRDLRWRGSFDLYIWNFDDEEETVHVNLTARRDHTFSVHAQNMSRSGSSRFRCPDGVHASYRPARGIVTLSVHRSCIPLIRQHPTLSMTVETEIWTDDGAGVTSVDDVRQATVRHN